MGIADRYAFYTSNDGQIWEPASKGEFANIQSNPIEQVIALAQTVKARYFKFSVLHVTKGNGLAVAELGIKAK
jgi:alpha-L-fucosidase